MSIQIANAKEEIKDFWGAYRKNKSGVIALAVILFFVIVALLANVISPYSPYNMEAAAWLPPSQTHLMGTDVLGRDVLSLVIWGARTTLEIGVVAAIISTLVGTAIGAMAGTSGTLVDNLLMRLTDTMLVIPTFFLALLFAFIFGGSFTNLVLIIGLTSWPTNARLVRAQVLSVKKFDFVDGAKAVGATNWRVLMKYILPNSSSVIIVAAALSTAGAMLTESYLSFLGAGDPNSITWGQVLSYALGNINAWWVVAFPGLALASTVIAFNLASQALNEALTLRTQSL